MKKTILVLTVVLSLLITSRTAQAQGGVYDGAPYDSTTIRLNSDTAHIIPDTATIPLWLIGHTYKSFFNTDTNVISMMTDTLNPYPINANNWFTIKFPFRYNTIIDFWHKYQTHTNHAGGIVEFSRDHGMTWQNIKGDCNTDSFLFRPGVLTTNFYTYNDTLTSGEPAFMGSSGTAQKYSRMQFFQGLPVRTTNGAGCNWSGIDTFYIRFRFVSDTTIDTLAGWAIDSIKIENDIYSGGVVHVYNNKASLPVAPNPSHDGVFTFPALTNERELTMEVYNAMGAQVLKAPYSHRLNLDKNAKGSYFYKVSGGSDYYTGRLQLE